MRTDASPRELSVHVALNIFKCPCRIIQSINFVNWQHSLAPTERLKRLVYSQIVVSFLLQLQLVMAMMRVSSLQTISLQLLVKGYGIMGPHVGDNTW